jgi:hypothetical protein
MNNKFLKTLNKVSKESQLSKGQNQNSEEVRTVMIKDDNGVLISHPTVNSSEGKLMKNDLKYNQKRGRDFCENYSPYYEKPISSLRPSYRRGGRFGC